MNRSDLILDLREKVPNYTSKQIEDSIKEIFRSIARSLMKGERVEVRGFGAFMIRNQTARISRNPKTGEMVKTKNKCKVYFKPGNLLKQSVNRN